MGLSCKASLYGYIKRCGLAVRQLCITVKMKDCFILGIVLATAIATAHSYYIGTAQYDITGPAAEINMVSLINAAIPIIHVKSK